MAWAWLCVVQELLFLLFNSKRCVTLLYTREKKFRLSLVTVNFFFTCTALLVPTNGKMIFSPPKREKESQHYAAKPKSRELLRPKSLGFAGLRLCCMLFAGPFFMGNKARAPPCHYHRILKRHWSRLQILSSFGLILETSCLVKSLIKLDFVLVSCVCERRPVRLI